MHKLHQKASYLHEKNVSKENKGPFYCLERHEELSFAGNKDQHDGFNCRLVCDVVAQEACYLLNGK